MNRVTSVLLVTGAVLLPIGWILVLSSGYHGDASGGSETVWRMGGLMLYVGGPSLLLAAFTHVAHLSATRCRRRRAAGH
jgi:hypothetical protein